MSNNLREQAVVTISRRAAERIRSGHVWVYRSDLIDAGGIGPGTLVRVQEAEERPARAKPQRGEDSATGKTANRAAYGKNLGTAFYSSASELALRLLSRGPIPNLENALRERIRAAIAYRDRFVRNSNAYRVIFSEGDFLPGLIVDRYNDILSLQVLTQAMDSEEIRKVFVTELAAALNPNAIVERVDTRVRKLEQLPEKESGTIYIRDEHVGTGVLTPLSGPTQGQQVPVTTEFEMNGIRFLYEALGTPKTGAFLDQRENYAAAAQYARGQALDVFCYQGGFALHLARVCERVIGVDSSRPALEIADKNAQLNGNDIEWIEANAFDLLRDCSDQGQQYDCIVLDPPAFAKAKRNLATALRGYKELNLRALKMLRPGGILVSCSCSYHVSTADLLETIQSAAQDSHRIARILENRGAAKDHPNVLGIPETAYLKCIIMLVS